FAKSRARDGSEPPLPSTLMISRGSDGSVTTAAGESKKATASCDQTWQPRTHDWTRNKQRTAERGSYVASRLLEKANDIRVVRHVRRNSQLRIAARNDAAALVAVAGSTIRSKRLCPQVCLVNGVTGNPPGAKTTNGIGRASVLRSTGNPNKISEVSTSKFSREQSGGCVDSTVRNDRVNPWHLRGSWLQNLDD